ncbi:MAG: hypothetical protein M1815_004589 [Lichina confinis]|nr:MAG: hypothetical protein M1815_004589 [Lichina confinis]
MSSSGEPNRNTAVAKDSDKATEASGMDQQQKKPAPHLEEDDEFEDFPVDDWTQEETDPPRANSNLWEESWDDDDVDEDFSAQLKYA